MPVREHVLKREDLPEVSELFLTGTTTEVLPIVRVDGELIADGKIGAAVRTGFVARPREPRRFALYWWSPACFPKPATESRTRFPRPA